MSTVTGTYFDGDRAQGRTVTVTFTPAATVELVAEGLAREWPLAEVRVSDRLGEVPRFLYLPDGAVVETPDNATIDAALADRRHGRFSALIHWLESQQRIAAVACFVVLFAVGALGYFGLPVLARTVAAGVPAEIDERIGQAALTALRPYFEPSQLRPEERKRVEQQLVRLRPTGPRPRLEFRSLRGGLPNAFALPGGRIIVTDELVRLGVTDDELAAVLAHELGHLDRRHGVRSLLQQSFALLVVAAVTGDVSTLTSFAATIPLSLLTAGYSRDLEREADQFALELLRARGIPPHAFSLALAKLEESRAKLPRTSTYVSTHPATEERTALFGGLTAEDRARLKLAPVEAAARGAVERGDLDEALTRCDEWVKLAPTVPAYVVRARCHLERFEYSAARADFDAALILDPAAPELTVLRIELLESEGALPAARFAAREFVAAQPGSSLGRGFLAYLLDTPTSHPGTLAELDTVLALTRTEARLWYWRAVVRHRAGDKVRALADLDTALGLRPGDHRARSLRAQLRSDQRQFVPAHEDLSAIRGPLTRTADFALRLAVAEARIGRIDAALATSQRGLDYETTPAVHQDLRLFRAGLAIAQKRWSDALKETDLVLDRPASPGPAHAMRATALRHLGLPEEALRALDRAQAAGLPEVDLLNERVETHFQSGNFAAGLAAADRFVSLRRDGFTLRSRGLLQFAEGHWTEAEADLVASLALTRRANGEYSEFFLLLARRRAQSPEHLDTFQATIARWPAGWAKSIGLYLSGQIPAARLLAEAETSRELSPAERRCEAHFYIGMTHLLAGDVAAARTSLEKCVATDVRTYYEHRLARAELARLLRE